MRNTIIISGYAGKAADIKTFDNGSKIASFTVAQTNKGYTTKEGKVIEEHTNWFRCVAKKHLANYAEKAISKGAFVIIEGEMMQRSYQDQQGNNREVWEVVVREMTVRKNQDGI